MFLTVLFALYCQAAILVKADCPAGWVHNGSSCYHLSHDTETWADAMVVCQTENAYLAEIFDEQENAFVQSIVAAGIGKKDAWLGGNDLFVEGQWIWADSHSDLNDYTNFLPGEPNNSVHNENCLDMEASGQWNDDQCHNMQQYVCEKESSGSVLVG